MSIYLKERVRGAKKCTLPNANAFFRAGCMSRDTLIVLGLLRITSVDWTTGLSVRLRMHA
jgi:hypothetical protein